MLGLEVAGVGGHTRGTGGEVAVVAGPLVLFHVQCGDAWMQHVQTRDVSLAFVARGTTRS